MKERIIIFAGGLCSESEHIKAILSEPAYIICVNGGCKNAELFKVVPNLIIGDLDSLPQDIKSNFEKQGAKIIIHPPEKDESDLELALNTAIVLSPPEIVILGATGKRTDHALFNMMLLFKAKGSGVPVRIVTEFEDIVSAEKEMLINEKKGTTISLVPFCTIVTGIQTEGFYYPLNNENLLMGSSRGLSNVLIDSPAKIKFKTGDMLVIINRETPALKV